MNICLFFTQEKPLLFFFLSFLFLFFEYCTNIYTTKEFEFLFLFCVSIAIQMIRRISYNQFHHLSLCIIYILFNLLYFTIYTPLYFLVDENPPLGIV